MTQTIPLPVTLLPCPFCGATDGQIVQAFTRATNDFAYWSVECLGCGAEIADDESQAAADAHWNMRHRLASVEDGERLHLAMKTIAEFPITDPRANMDAYNMALIARAALTGSAAE